MDSIYAEPRATWLPTVLAEVRKLTPERPPGVAYVYDTRGPAESWNISYPIVDGGPSDFAEATYQSFKVAPLEFRRRLFASLKPAGLYSETMGELMTDQHAQAREASHADAFYVNAVDPDGRGVLLTFNVGARARLVPTQRKRLSLIAAHVSAARRLLASGQTTPDAIFTPAGKVAHVERGHESALTSLRDRVVHLARVRRGATRTDPDDVLASWSALVRGTYTLVGRVESDGQRFVIAYANAPGVHDPRGLTKTEAAIAGWIVRGHSQKLIAYELGLSVGAISGLLARVYEKLRVRSRVELAARLAPPERLTRVPVDDRELLVFSGSPPDASPDELASLTPAERRVLRGVVSGEKTAAIAASLGKSEHTITHQIGSVFRRLGVTSRGELIAKLAARRCDGEEPVPSA
ncbi:MAG: helix-turn-helix transcriptional regulator [Labilithrix sp.]|nr:helix-turn-helix transcriptional regulator [Labilithrix sp.]MCW5810822.1 helix-turn-helix transcriptional regulator [Labilithrix sp.]